MASDMFSLGATLLYAATGHAALEGETVMDVLVRLATEPPDLSGLPDELTELVTACLERSAAATARPRPRCWPSWAVRGRLAQDAETDGHAYLTAPEMALIEEYQRSPQPPTRSADDGRGTGDDELQRRRGRSASHTALTARLPQRCRATGLAAPGAAPGTGRPAARRPAPRTRSGHAD